VGARVDVTATSADGHEGCTGSAVFDVVKNATTRVRVALICQGLDDGIIHITIGVACPTAHLVSYTVSPLSATVGDTIDVAAVDEDPDAGALQYTWMATTGAFADDSAAATTYLCTNAGPVTMTLVASSDACQEAHAIAATCVAPGADAGD
jgi:hypothetical protein